MAVIDGVNFLFEYNGDGGSGFKAAEIANLISKLTTLLSSDQIRAFLAPLAGQDVYLTTSWPSDFQNENKDNSQAIGANYYDTALSNGVLTGYFTSGATDPSGGYLLDSSLSSVNILPHLVIAFDPRQLADFRADTVQAIDKDGTAYNETLYRVIFHELAHLVSLPTTAFFNAFGDDVSTSENIAIAAENLIYAPSNEQRSRIGHAFKLTGGNASNDPKLAFQHVTSNVIFSEGTGSNGQYNASFGGLTADGRISKTYYAPGRDAANQAVEGQIELDAVADERILKTDGSATPLLSDLLAGVAHDNTTESRIASSSRLLTELNKEAGGVLTSLNGASIGAASSELWSMLSGVGFANVRRASGISNEMSVDHALLSGPILNTGENSSTKAPVLAQKSLSGGLLIGASGANQLNVNFTQQSDLLVGLDGVTNVLVAGSGKGAAPNELMGASGNDILIGGQSNDVLHADQGSDIVIQSSGNDRVIGDGKTIFVASEGNDHPEFDTTHLSDGNYLVSNGAGGGNTILSDVSTFVGNQKRTTFVGNGTRASTFIAGAGGGDFTLLDGDVAVGNPDVVNIYRISTSLTPDGRAPTVTILNLGPQDVIYVDGNKAAFNGNTHSYSISGGGLGEYVVNEKGTSSWKTKYPVSTIKENNTKVTTTLPFDPVNDLPNAIALLQSRGLATENNILNITQLHDHPNTTFIVYSQEQLAQLNGSLPDFPYTVLYMNDGHENLPHAADYEPALPGPSYLSPQRSDILAQGGERRDVAFVKAGANTADGTIVFSDTLYGVQIAGLNLSITGFENGKSAGGVYFSTNDIEFDSQGKPHTTEQFGPSSPAWQHVYQSNIAPGGPPPQLDLSTPASSLGQPFNPVIPTRIYDNAGGGINTNQWEDEPERSLPTLAGDTNDNDLAFARSYALITGNGGHDVFRYALGDGNVGIDETNPGTINSRLEIGAGIDPSTVAVRGNEYGDLILTLGNGNEITLIKALQSTSAEQYGVQTVTFSDGTNWSYDDLVGRVASTPSPTHVLYGDATMQIFDPAGNASLVQGAGGGDVIDFERGSGPLNIFEAEADADAVNTLRFSADILPDDVSVDGDVNGDLLLTVGSDRITIEGGLANASGNAMRYGVQAVEFANGVMWTLADIIGRLSSSGGQSALYGDGDGQIFDTQGYAHGVVGGGGGDTVVYDSGYGGLFINELDVSATPDNVLQLGSGLSSDQLSVKADQDGNLILDFGGSDIITLTGALLSTSGATRGVQYVVFTGEGNLTLSLADLLTRADTPTETRVDLYGDTRANEFDSLGIARSITGNGGGDTFAYDRGYGSLTINERDAAATPDNQIHFAAGILATDVSISGTESGDLVLDLGDGDKITLTAALRSSGSVQNGVQKVVFDDGTTWTYADIINVLATASATRTSLYGDGAANTLDSHGLATSIVGGGGGDTIVFGQGYGALTVDEYEPDENQVNTLAFGPGIDSSDLVVSGTIEGDLVLSVGGGDQVTLKNALIDGAAGMQQITFADGTALTSTDLFARVSTGSAFNSDIYGGAGPDLLDGLGLAHNATGNGGGDSFVFARGYGALTINEHDTSGSADNILYFGDSIAQDDIDVSSTATGDLIIDLGGGDRISISHALVHYDNAVSGVQQVVFTDGTALSYDDLVALALTPAPGRTDLYGDFEANTLDGEGIAAHLVGGGGGDTFVFNEGYGSLTIDETDIVGRTPNVLVLGSGIAVGDVNVTANADGDLLLEMSAGDEVIIRGALTNIDGSGTVTGIQQVKFSDGTIWSYDDLMARMAPTDDHVLYGDSNAQVFNVDGLAAKIVGHGGGDLIHYVAGQGAFTIDEADAGLAPNNRIVLDTSITASQASVTDDGNGNAVIALGNGDQITIVGQFAEPEPSSVAGVQSVVFGDGTVWTAEDLQRLATGVTQYVVGGDALEIDEALLPTTGRPAIDIDPTLSLSDLDVDLEPGGNTLTLSLSGQPAVVFSNILVNGALADQLISFDDGTTVSLGDLVASAADFSDIGSLRGTAAAETFDTRGLLPHVTGGGGGDTFNYVTGYGLVEISETSPTGSASNTLQFAAGIDPGDVTVTGTESGDILLLLPDGDQVSLMGALKSDAATSYGVQQVSFANGTIWDYEDLLSRAGQVTDGSTGLYGDAGAQTFDTQGVSHLVVGGGGGDTIAYNLGYGHLRISEIDPDSSATNVLEFATGIVPGTVTVLGDPAGNVTLSLGGQDQITIDRQAAIPGDQNQGLEEIHFADGTIWDRSDLLALAYPAGDYPGSGGAPVTEGDAGNNDLTGAAGPDILIGHGGDDTLSGLGGDDEYRYASGDGNDAIMDNGLSTDTDILRLTDLNSADVSLFRSDERLIVRDNSTGQQITVYSQFNPDPAVGIEQIAFADGTTWDRTRIAQEAWIEGDSFNNAIAGTDGNDTIVGGLGNDSLSGGAGSDTYRYASGDGADEIGDQGNPVDVDTLKLTDLDPADIALSRDGFDLLVTDTATGQVIRVDTQFLLAGYGIEQIAFADGTIWNRQAIAKNAWIVGDTGNNFLTGSDDSETFQGGQGDDYAWGGAGSDDYRYASGDGNDQIDDSGSVADVDKLNLTDVASTGVELRRDGPNLFLKINSTGEEIEILNQFYSDASYGIEQISFSDGTTWDRSDITAKAWIRGDGGDNQLAGTGSDDILVGAGGNDYLEGKTGSDTYRYSSGDGNDRIHESGALSDTDTLKLLDLDPGDVTAFQDGRDLKIRDDNTGQTITVDNQFYGNGRYGIEQVTFADGTTWNRDDIAAEVDGGEMAEIFGAAGNDNLVVDNGTFQRTDGSSSALADVALNFDSSLHGDSTNLAARLASGGGEHDWVWRQFDQPFARLPVGALMSDARGGTDRAAARLAESIAVFGPLMSGLNDISNREPGVIDDMFHAATRPGGIPGRFVES